VTTVLDVQKFKDEGKRFAMLTAYDYPTARLLDEAGIPILLIGDSVGNNELGYANTVPVTMDEMIHHAKAVSRGAQNALLVGDLPFMSYQHSLESALLNAGRFLKEAGTHTVKLEGGSDFVLEAVTRMTESGIPVMGHLGLTPQSVNLIGFRVQGKTPEAAAKLVERAQRLEAAGVFALVLEGVPSDVAAEITRALRIPTIGIGAGPNCDGQVLVVHDMLGLNSGRAPKFVKRYADLDQVIVDAARRYAEEVASGVFPDEAHSYGVSKNGSQPAAQPTLTSQRIDH